MREIFEIGIVILGFLGLGFAIDYLSSALYWRWMDWKNREDR